MLQTQKWINRAAFRTLADIAVAEYSESAGTRLTTTGARITSQTCVTVTAQMTPSEEGWTVSVRQQGGAFASAAPVSGHQQALRIRALADFTAAAAKDMAKLLPPRPAALLVHSIEASVSYTAQGMPHGGCTYSVHLADGADSPLGIHGMTHAQLQVLLTALRRALDAIPSALLERSDDSNTWRVVVSSARPDRDRDLPLGKYDRSVQETVVRAPDDASAVILTAHRAALSYILWRKPSIANVSFGEMDLRVDRVERIESRDQRRLLDLQHIVNASVFAA